MFLASWYFQNRLLWHLGRPSQPCLESPLQPLKPCIWAGIWGIQGLFLGCIHSSWGTRTRREGVCSSWGDNDGLQMYVHARQCLRIMCTLTDWPVEIKLGVHYAVFDQHGEVFSCCQDGGSAGQRGASVHITVYCWENTGMFAYFGGCASISRGHHENTSHVFMLLENSTHCPVCTPKEEPTLTLF